jgi:hypothetical protein
MSINAADTKAAAEARMMRSFFENIKMLFSKLAVFALEPG